MNEKEPITVGQKIRETRIAKGLTQGALAGGEITRNMMCRIETGSATPSRATLAYIADRLDIPLLYLLDDTLTLTECCKHLYLPNIQKEFAAGHYEEVLRLLHRHFKEYDDELALIAADSLTELAKKKVHNGNLESADKLIKEALSLTEATVYPTAHLRASLALLSAITSNVQSPRYEIKEEDYLSARESASMQDLYAYLTEDTASCRDPILSEHLSARDMLRSRNYKGALSTLESMEERRTELNLSAFVLFRIYTDLENCHRELGDYQNAYRYANKRISMLAAFKS